MIVLILASRQSGKTTFAINEILLKRKEKFIFFCYNEAMRQHIKKYLIKNGKNDYVDRILPQSENILFGRNYEYIICDEYDVFNKKFRENLSTYYSCGKIKIIFLFSSYYHRNTSDSIPIIGEDDIFFHPKIHLISCGNEPISNSELNNYIKQVTVKERLEK